MEKICFQLIVARGHVRCRWCRWGVVVKVMKPNPSKKCRKNAVIVYSSLLQILKWKNILVQIIRIMTQYVRFSLLVLVRSTFPSTRYFAWYWLLRRVEYWFPWWASWIWNFQFLSKVYTHVSQAKSVEFSLDG